MTAGRPSPAPRTLDDWLAHIQTQHWRSIDLRLERIARVWENLRQNLGVARSKTVIAIAGTNGKGSCVALLDAVLRAAGLSVGAYTSPHLARYNERVAVNGRAVDDAELCAAFAAVEAARTCGDARIPLTYFEFGTLCALVIFHRRRVQVALLEVGMGGRLDAVNLVDNDLALIASIGIDHAQWLGDNRDAIAAEKAGIFKPGAVAVCADPAPPPGIAAVAAERGCKLIQAGVDYQIERAGAGVVWRSEHEVVPADWRCLHLRPPPPFDSAVQAGNLGGAIAALAALAAPAAGQFGGDGGGGELSELSAQHLADGLAGAALPARCQVMAGAPEVILDVAHNPDSAAALAAFLARRKTRDQTPGKTHAVFAALADKPVADIAAAVGGEIDAWHLATLGGERGQSAAALAAQLAAGDAVSGAPVSAHNSPLAAYQSARAAADARDRIAVFGSFQLVGVILAHLETAASHATDATEATLSHRESP